MTHKTILGPVNIRAKSCEREKKIGRRKLRLFENDIHRDVNARKREYDAFDDRRLESAEFDFSRVGVFRFRRMASSCNEVTYINNVC